MASQDDGGIDVVFRLEQHETRLIELPEKLAEAITRQYANSLSIKSTSSALQNARGSGPANAVLCIGPQTFQIRQVHSSNTILLLEPSKSATQADGRTLSVIASPNSTFELHEVSYSAEACLEEILVTYNGPEDTHVGAQQRTLAGSPTQWSGTRAIFDDVPASADECQRAWMEICAFEHAGVAHKPSPEALIAVWKSLYSATAAAGIDITGTGQCDVEGLWNVIEDDGYPRPLFDAVMSRISRQEESVKACPTFDAGKCVPWIGVQMLRSACAYEQAATLHQFLDDWRDSVPESWRKTANLESIKVSSLGEPSSQRHTSDSCRISGPLRAANADVNHLSTSPKPERRAGKSSPSVHKARIR